MGSARSIVVAPAGMLRPRDGSEPGVQHPSHSGSVSAAAVAISFPALRLPAMFAPYSRHVLSLH
ncbi:MAG TPA: hypothetical protein DCR15_11700 [Arthrobacter bacterium]|nr:hypothetical protein [Arthrobacter sp.]HAP90358.1 hypothetical protein [Arthrobacter sp.]HBH59084.1 hypothetical protein [Arthrobacter sp.]